MNPQEILGLISAIIPLIIHIPYIKGTLAGTLTPHPFTWILWTLITTIIFFAQWQDGAGPGSWGTGTAATICAVIALIALKNGLTHITKTDMAMFLAGLLSIPLWLLNQSPTLSVLLLTTISLLAYIPTYRKSWHNPHQEAVYLFAINTVKHGLSLFAITHLSIATTTFPLSMTLSNGGLALFLLWRRKIVTKNKKSARKR